MGFFSASVGIKYSNEAEFLAVVKTLEQSSLQDDFIGVKLFF